MKKALMILALGLQVLPAWAQQPLVDEKTGDYTPRAIVAAMIGGAQVVEMRCGIKGQIKAALAKAESLGTPFDLSDKMDFSDAVFFATEALKKVDKIGAAKWCKDTAPKLMQLLQSR
jgi:hypothetical protein